MKENKINTIKDLNKKRVLEFIISEQPTILDSICYKTKLTKATVSTIVSDYVEKGIITTKEGPSTGGRKPFIITIVENNYYTICLNYLLNVVEGCIMNLNGEIINYSQQTLSNPQDLDTSINESFNLIDTLKSSYKKDVNFIGISISIDSSVYKNGVVKLSPSKNWKNVNLNSIFQKKYDLKCFTNNEANLAALGENSFFLKSDNICLLSMKTGVGLGIITDKVLTDGNEGLGGELGHTIVEINGKQCECGNKGCIEKYVSITSLINNVEKATGKRCNLDEIIKLYMNKTPSILKIIENYCYYMSVLLTNTINIFNPSHLVISNDLLDKLPELLTKIIQHVNYNVSSCDKIDLNTSNINIRLLGAGVVSIKNFLEIKHYFSNQYDL